MVWEIRNNQRGEQRCGGNTKLKNCYRKRFQNKWNLSRAEGDVLWRRKVVLLGDQLGGDKEMTRESAFCKKQCSGERDAGFVLKRTLKTREGLEAGKRTHMNLFLCKR